MRQSQLPQRHCIPSGIPPQESHDNRCMSQWKHPPFATRSAQAASSHQEIVSHRDTRPCCHGIVTKSRLSTPYFQEQLVVRLCKTKFFSETRICKEARKAWVTRKLLGHMRPRVPLRRSLEEAFFLSLLCLPCFRTTSRHQVVVQPNPVFAAIFIMLQMVWMKSGVQMHGQGRMHASP